MKGFTLVEMLVALFIFALLTAAGVTMLRVTSDNQAIIRAHAERLAAFQRTRAILKGDLVQAAARRVRGVDGQAIREAFYGGDSVADAPLLRLARRGWDNPDAEPRPSVQFVEYRLIDGRLERAARRNLDGGDLAPAQILIDRVRSADIAFLWRNQWIETLPGGPDDPLPQAVKLDLVFDDIGPVSQLFAVTGESQ